MLVLGSARVPQAQAPKPSSLTAVPALARVYDAIFDARFDDVPAALEQACGPRVSAPGRGLAATPSTLRAPAEACQLLEVVALWWQIQLDPDSLALDARFEVRADETIAAIRAWTEREPQRAEAWFYLGGAFGARAQWKVLRGERLAAAREGRDIKQALEKALELDPALEDAYFGIGLYHYYADVAPAAARMLRWLLALPGGDRAQGLREMLRARQSGALVRGEADYQLHLIYLWYEKQPEQALQLLRGLAQAHPRNPHFAIAAADLEDVYLSDHAASLASWRALLDAARARRVAEPVATEMRARVGIARQLDRLYETDAAVEQLRIVIEARPAAPFGIAALAQLRLGQALDRLGLRTDALVAYRAALEAAPDRDLIDVAGQARAGLRKAPDAEAATAYRLSLEGLRAVERGDLDDAARALARALSIRPGDQVTRFRHARLLEAQKQTLAAIELYERVMSAAPDETPPGIFTLASLRAARLYEQQGDVARAIELYDRARTAFGGDAATRDAAARALTRLAAAANRPR